MDLKNLSWDDPIWDQDDDDDGGEDEEAVITPRVGNNHDDDGSVASPVLGNCDEPVVDRCRTPQAIYDPSLVRGKWSQQFGDKDRKIVSGGSSQGGARRNQLRSNKPYQETAGVEENGRMRDGEAGENGRKEGGGSGVGGDRRHTKKGGAPRQVAGEIHNNNHSSSNNEEESEWRKRQPGGQSVEVEVEGDRREVRLSGGDNDARRQVNPGYQRNRNTERETSRHQLPEPDRRGGGGSNPKRRDGGKSGRKKFKKQGGGGNYGGGGGSGINSARDSHCGGGGGSGINSARDSHSGGGGGSGINSARDSHGSSGRHWTDVDGYSRPATAMESSMDTRFGVQDCRYGDVEEQTTRLSDLRVVSNNNRRPAVTNRRPDAADDSSGGGGGHRGPYPYREFKATGSMRRTGHHRRGYIAEEGRGNNQLERSMQSKEGGEAGGGYATKEDPSPGSRQSKGFQSSSSAYSIRQSAAFYEEPSNGSDWRCGGQQHRNYQQQPLPPCDREQDSSHFQAQHASNRHNRHG